MFKRRSVTGSMAIDTLIGRQVSIQGDIRFRGGLYVDGRVAGSVQAAEDPAAAVSISEHGIIEGSVAAAQVIVNGRVEGDICGSRRVVLGSKAEVRGNVRYAVIEMALGAKIDGRLLRLGGIGAEADSQAEPAGGAAGGPGSFDAPADAA